MEIISLNSVKTRKKKKSSWGAKEQLYEPWAEVCFIMDMGNHSEDTLHEPVSGVRRGL